MPDIEITYEEDNLLNCLLNRRDAWELYEGILDPTMDADDDALLGLVDTLHAKLHPDGRVPHTEPKPKPKPWAGPWAPYFIR